LSLAGGEPADRVLDTTPWGQAWTTLEEQRPRSTGTMLSEAVGALQKSGVDATGGAVPAFAPEQLERVCDRVDLLVVGSRGYGAARRVVHGSTSDALLHSAHCPVLVVPRGVTTRERGTSGAQAA
jgi:nucleotide-binding universal stress UspA family protein